MAIKVTIATIKQRIATIISAMQDVLVTTQAAQTAAEAAQAAAEAAEAAAEAAQAAAETAETNAETARDAAIAGVDVLYPTEAARDSDLGVGTNGDISAYVHSGGDRVVIEQSNGSAWSEVGTYVLKSYTDQADATTDARTMGVVGLQPNALGLTAGIVSNRGGTNKVLLGFTRSGLVKKGYHFAAAEHTEGGPNSLRRAWHLTNSGTYDALSATRERIYVGGVSPQEGVPVRQLSRVGNMDAIFERMRKYLDGVDTSAVKIVFVGDSITRGGQNIPSNHWHQRLAQHLKDAFPGITFSFVNLAIGGKSLENLVDATFVAGTDFSESAYPDGLLWEYTWPSGSNTPDSWLTHVEDEAAYLVILAHGMNDSAESDFKDDLDTFVAAAGGWTEDPSITLVSNWTNVENSNEQDKRALGTLQRYYARTYDLGLIDAGRLHEMILRAWDFGHLQWDRLMMPYGYNSENYDFTIAGGATVSAGTFTVPSGGTFQCDAVHGLDVAAAFNVNLVDATGEIKFGYRGRTGMLAGYHVSVEGDGTITLYYGSGSTVVATDSVVLSDVTDVDVVIRSDGARHRVWIDGVTTPVIDVTDWRHFDTGKVGWRGVTNACVVTAASVYAGFPSKYAHIRYSERELYGRGVNAISSSTGNGGDDWTYNPFSPGGNAVNHPSHVAQSAVYGAAAVDWAEAFVRQFWAYYYANTTL